MRRSNRAVRQHADSADANATPDPQTSRSKQKPSLNAFFVKSQSSVKSEASSSRSNNRNLGLGHEQNVLFLASIRSASTQLLEGGSLESEEREPNDNGYLQPPAPHTSKRSSSKLKSFETLNLRSLPSYDEDGGALSNRTNDPKSIFGMPLSSRWDSSRSVFSDESSFTCLNVETEDAWGSLQQEIQRTCWDNDSPSSPIPDFPRSGSLIRPSTSAEWEAYNSEVSTGFYVFLRVLDGIALDLQQRVAQKSTEIVSITDCVESWTAASSAYAKSLSYLQLPTFSNTESTEQQASCETPAPEKSSDGNHETPSTAQNDYSNCKTPGPLSPFTPAPIGADVGAHSPPKVQTKPQKRRGNDNAPDKSEGGELKGDEKQSVNSISQQLPTQQQSLILENVPAIPLTTKLSQNFPPLSQIMQLPPLEALTRCMHVELIAYQEQCHSIESDITPALKSLCLQHKTAAKMSLEVLAQASIKLKSQLSLSSQFFRRLKQTVEDASPRQGQADQWLAEKNFTDSIYNCRSHQRQYLTSLFEIIEELIELQDWCSVGLAAILARWVGYTSGAKKWSGEALGHFAELIDRRQMASSDWNGNIGKSSTPDLTNKTEFVGNQKKITLEEKLLLPAFPTFDLPTPDLQTTTPHPLGVSCISQSSQDPDSPRWHLSNGDAVLTPALQSNGELLLTPSLQTSPELTTSESTLWGRLPSPAPTTPDHDIDLDGPGTPCREEVEPTTPSAPMNTRTAKSAARNGGPVPYAFSPTTTKALGGKGPVEKPIKRLAWSLGPENLGQTQKTDLGQEETGEDDLDEDRKRVATLRERRKSVSQLLAWMSQLPPVTDNSSEYPPCPSVSIPLIERVAKMIGTPVGLVGNSSLIYSSKANAVIGNERLVNGVIDGPLHWQPVTAVFSAQHFFHVFAGEDLATPIWSAQIKFVEMVMGNDGSTKDDICQLREKESLQTNSVAQRFVNAVSRIASGKPKICLLKFTEEQQIQWTRILTPFTNLSKSGNEATPAPSLNKSLTTPDPQDKQKRSSSPDTPDQILSPSISSTSISSPTASGKKYLGRLSVVSRYFGRSASTFDKTAEADKKSRLSGDKHKEEIAEEKEEKEEKEVKKENEEKVDAKIDTEESAVESIEDIAELNLEE